MCCAGTGEASDHDTETRNGLAARAPTCRDEGALAGLVFRFA